MDSARSAMVWRSGLLCSFMLIAFVPFPGRSCSDDDKCCIRAGSYIRVGHNSSYPVSVTTVSAAKACFTQLGSVAYSLREQIVSNLLAKLRNMYVFYDIVRNSTAVDSCKVPYAIHQMTYNIDAELQSAINQTHVWPFFEAIARAFRQLNDAHTQFYSPFHPWNFFRPVIFSSRLSRDGTQEIYISAVNPLLGILDSISPIAKNKQQWSKYVKQTVKRVNDMDALTFIQRQADNIGLYKSRGAQFNEYLKSVFFSLGQHDLPINDTEVYQLENGHRVTADLFVVVTDPRTANGSKNLNTYLTAQEGSVMSPSRSPVLLTQAITYYNDATLYNPSRNWELKKSSISHVGDLAVIFELDNALVLKLPGVIGVSQNNGFIQENIGFTLQRLIKRAADKKYQTLIIDVLGNNGGVLSASYMLMGMLLGKRHLDPVAMCELYDRRVTSLWDQWIRAFADVPWAGQVQQLSENQVDELVEIIVTQNSDFQKNFDLKMSSFYKTFVEPKLVLPLQKLMALASTDRTDDAQRILRDFLMARPFGLKTSDNEWFPMTEQVNPNPGENYRNLSYYRQPVKRFRGGRTAYYTQKFFQGCIDGLKAAKTLSDSEYLFREIIFLTDGTCGGACSLALSKLQVGSYAKVVSVGGVLGEAMDTGFAGGYIENFPEFFEETRLSEILGRILFNTSIRESFVALEKPPAPVKFTMTMNELYLKELGECALPREWYLIPAQKHINVWLSQGDDWPAPDHQLLLEIYRQAAHYDEIPLSSMSSPTTVTSTTTSSSRKLPEAALFGIVTASLVVVLVTSVFLIVRYKRYKKEPILVLKRQEVTPLDDASLSLTSSHYFSHDD